MGGQERCDLGVAMDSEVGGLKNDIVLFSHGVVIVGQGSRRAMRRQE